MSKLRPSRGKIHSDRAVRGLLKTAGILCWKILSLGWEKKLERGRIFPGGKDDSTWLHARKTREGESGRKDLIKFSGEGKTSLPGPGFANTEVGRQNMSIRGPFSSV